MSESTQTKDKTTEKCVDVAQFPQARPIVVEWIQPSSTGRVFHLRAGEICLATLSFRSGSGTFATAETTAGIWTFKRIGFLNPKITIRRIDTQEDIAVYRPHVWGDGKIVFTDGHTYTWKPTNFWSIEWSLLDPAGEVVLGIKPGLNDQKLSDMLKTQATMDIARGPADESLLPLFATFGMYLLVIHQMDSVAITTASTA